MAVKRLVIKPEEGYYDSDVHVIVRKLASIGYEITDADAQAAWERYSDSMSAGWLILPDDPWEIYYAVAGQCREVDY